MCIGLNDTCNEIYNISVMFGIQNSLKQEDSLRSLLLKTWF